MGYDNNELTRKWYEMKRYAWTDQKFEADIEGIRPKAQCILWRSQL